MQVNIEGVARSGHVTVIHSSSLNSSVVYGKRAQYPSLYPLLIGLLSFSGGNKEEDRLTI